MLREIVCPASGVNLLGCGAAVAGPRRACREVLLDQPGETSRSKQGPRGTPTEAGGER
jgi:hypothetical protein